MGISPIFAIPKALKQAGLTKEDVDVYEVRLVSISSMSMLKKDRLTRPSLRNLPTALNNLKSPSRRSIPSKSKNIAMAASDSR